MENTLKKGDRLIGYRLVKKYKRGDIAIFHYDDKDYYIKRVIGIPGDKVEIRKNNVYVNNKKLNEPYIKEEMETDDAVFEVPKDSYFFLGDNRNCSKDSRYWEDPFRTSKDMVAKPLFRYWPLNKIGFVK